MENYKILVKGIVQKEDKFLLVERWYDDRIVNPYQWEFIDGVLPHGESPDQAVKRIIEESTGLVAEINRIIYTWSFMLGDVHTIGIAYHCLTVMDEVVLSEELNDFKWVSKDEIKDYIENQKVLDDIDRAELAF